MSDFDELHEITGIERHDALFKEAAALRDTAQRTGDTEMEEEASRLAAEAYESVIERNCRRDWHLYFPDEPVPEDAGELIVRLIPAIREANEIDKTNREIQRIEKRLIEEE